MTPPTEPNPCPRCGTVTDMPFHTCTTPKGEGDFDLKIQGWTALEWLNYQFPATKGNAALQYFLNRVEQLHTQLTSAREEIALCQKMLGYEDGSLFENVTRYMRYCEGEIALRNNKAEASIKYIDSLKQKLDEAVKWIEECKCSTLPAKNATLAKLLQ